MFRQRCRKTAAAFVFVRPRLGERQSVYGNTRVAVAWFTRAWGGKSCGTARGGASKWFPHYREQPHPEPALTTQRQPHASFNAQVKDPLRWRVAGANREIQSCSPPPKSFRKGKDLTTGRIIQTTSGVRGCCWPLHGKVDRLVFTNSSRARYAQQLLSFRRRTHGSCCSI